MLNEQGGVNGRKITFISYDDAYTPPKTVEQTRKLVESDGVFLIFNSLGTPTNTAVQKYLNQKRVPQLFVGTGATKWGEPKHFPWTIGWQPNYQSEGRIYATYILEQRAESKIAVLYQNDDYGKDYVKGLKDGLGNKAKSMIVAEAPYETTDPTVDSQVVNLRPREPISSTTSRSPNSPRRRSARPSRSVGNPSISSTAYRIRLVVSCNRPGSANPRTFCRPFI